ncbi:MULTISPECIES: AraC family transcriptional regulator [unclassified Streptomyces]|uniref:AraC family transcriptional regulator n=1 Tax=unclassified Streptomyces TaxID=2593676 RepID=UPI00224D4C43|nr:MULTISPECIES: helix-turn-helix domain-containing protein [unclassified Streptomyces]MCX5249971.1 helix-turn-helix domain-containing protein [Streptomyces sp. NBC_00201]
MTNAVSREILPTPEVLRPWIAGVASVSVGDVPTEPFVHLPEAAAKVVVRTGENGNRSTLVIGPRARASYHRGKRRASCVELRLAPGTVRPLLGIPAVDLLGRAMRLADLPGPGARRLADELRRLEPEEALAHLADVLPERLAAATDRSRTELLRAGVDAMSVRRGHVPGAVGAVARELAVSERQLRNLFAEGVGLSPKHYARIDRVRSVLDQAATQSWAELAATTGYYDQSHMTTDFRTLMGVPPRSYFSGRLPQATPCQAIRRS